MDNQGDFSVPFQIGNWTVSISTPKIQTTRQTNVKVIISNFPWLGCEPKVKCTPDSLDISRDKETVHVTPFYCDDKQTPYRSCKKRGTDRCKNMLEIKSNDHAFSQTDRDAKLTVSVIFHCPKSHFNSESLYLAAQVTWNGQTGISPVFELPFKGAIQPKLTEFSPPHGPADGGIAHAVGRFMSLKVKPDAKLSFLGFGPNPVSAQKVFPHEAYIHFPSHPPAVVAITALVGGVPIPENCQFTFRSYAVNEPLSANSTVPNANLTYGSFNFDTTQIPNSTYFNSDPIAPADPVYGFTEIHINACNLDELKKLANLFPKEAFAQKDFLGRQPIAYAIMKPATDCVEYLVEFSQLDEEDGFGMLPFDYADEEPEDLDMADAHVSAITNVNNNNNNHGKNNTNKNNINNNNNYNNNTNQSITANSNDNNKNNSEITLEKLQLDNNNNTETPKTQNNKKLTQNNESNDGALPLTLVHKRVRINDERARVVLHYADGERQIVEFLNGPDKGTKVNTISAAITWLNQSNARGWSDFLVEKTDLPLPYKATFINTRSPEDFDSIPMLDKQGKLKEYAQQASGERNGTWTVQKGDQTFNFTGLAVGKQNSKASAVAPGKMTLSKYNIILVRHLGERKMAITRNKRRNADIYYCLSEFLAMKPDQIVRDVQEILDEPDKYPDLVEYLYEKVGENSEYDINIQKLLELYAAACKYKLIITVHGLHNDGRYFTETIPTSSGAWPRCHLAYRSLDDHYDIVQPVNTTESETESEPMDTTEEPSRELIRGSRDAPYEIDSDSDGSDGGYSSDTSIEYGKSDDFALIDDVNDDPIEALITPDFSKKIADILDAIIKNPRVPISFREFREALAQISEKNQGIYGDLLCTSFSELLANNILEPEITKLMRQLLPYGANVTYKNVAYLIEKLITQVGDSDTNIAEKLSLGVVVAREYLEKSTTGHGRQKSINCLVAGFVQSGKTANMIVVTAILVDHGFNKIFVSSGRTIPLRNQTAYRYDQVFGKKSPTNEHPSSTDSDTIPMSPAQVDPNEAANEDDVPIDDLLRADVDVLEMAEDTHTYTDLGLRMLRRLQAGTPQEKARPTVFILKKHLNIVTNAANLLKDIHETIGETHAIKAAWFDDEGDESVNTRKIYPTQIHMALKNLASACHKYCERYVYFSYTATTAACLLGERGLFYPDIIAFMFLNQPSYLGLEHFVSPTWICRMSTVHEDMVDFLELENQRKKSILTLFSSNPHLVRFVARVYARGGRILEQDLLRIESKHLKGKGTDTKPLVHYNYTTNASLELDISEIYVTAKMLIEGKYAEKIPPQIARGFLEGLKPTNPNIVCKNPRSWNVEDTRIAEMHYLSEVYDSVLYAPMFLLVFVFRSIICWVVYEERIDGKSNNLYSILLEHLNPQATEKILSFEDILEDNECLSLMASFPKQDYTYWRKNNYPPEDLPQRLFQWKDRQASEVAVLFLARRFGITIHILGAGGEELLLVPPEPDQQNPHVYITCSATDYKCSNTPPKVAKTIKTPHVSAFAHVSGRQIAHLSVARMIVKILAELRKPHFWNHITESAPNPRYEKWGAAFLRAYDDTVYLHNRFCEIEQEESMDTIITSDRRPLIPTCTSIIEKARALVGKKGANGEYLCDIVLRMANLKKNKKDKYEDVLKYNVQDLVDTDRLPIYAFIVGGNCFTRGVTLPDPLCTLYLRHVGYQDELTQYMRFLGHRNPAALDLMCVIVGMLQLAQFERLWNTMSHNYIALLHHSEVHNGVINKSKVSLLQTPQLLAVAPKKRQFATEDDYTLPSKISVPNPPKQGEKAFQAFHNTNTLFNFLMEHYNGGCPGTKVAVHNADNKSNVYKYTNPGILFREVHVTDAFLHFFAEQEKNYEDPVEKNKSLRGGENAAAFSTLFKALQVLKGKSINLAFVHQGSKVESHFKEDTYIKKYRGELAQNGIKEEKKLNILQYISPLNTGREDDAKFYKPKVTKVHLIDAYTWDNKQGTRKATTIIREYEHYVLTNSRRSPEAPPLLLIFLVNPTFVSGGKEQRKFGGQFEMDKSKHCDYPPTSYIFYHQDNNPISMLRPDLGQERAIITKRRKA